MRKLLALLLVLSAGGCAAPFKVVLVGGPQVFPRSAGLGPEVQIMVQNQTSKLAIYNIRLELACLNASGAKLGTRSGFMDELEAGQSGLVKIGTEPGTVAVVLQTAVYRWGEALYTIPGEGTRWVVQ